jgi:hypothetical protein
MKRFASGRTSRGILCRGRLAPATNPEGSFMGVLAVLARALDHVMETLARQFLNSASSRKLGRFVHQVGGTYASRGSGTCGSSPDGEKTRERASVRNRAWWQLTPPSTAGLLSLRDEGS